MVLWLCCGSTFIVITVDIALDCQLEHIEFPCRTVCKSKSPVLIKYGVLIVGRLRNAWGGTLSHLGGVVQRILEWFLESRSPRCQSGCRATYCGGIRSRPRCDWIDLFWEHPSGEVIWILIIGVWEGLPRWPCGLRHCHRLLALSSLRAYSDGWVV